MAVVLYTILTLVIFTILEVISARVLFGYLEWGNVGVFLSYFGIQAVLHCAFMIVKKQCAQYAAGCMSVHESYHDALRNGEPSDPKAGI